MVKVTQEAEKVKRTSAGLRDALFDELDELRSGKSNPAKASAVSRLADTVINTVVMELEVQRTLGRIGRAPDMSALPAPIALGA